MKALRLLRKVLSDFNLTSGEDAKGKHRQLYEIFQLVLKCQFTPDEYYTYRFFEKGKRYSTMLNYMPKYHSLKYFHPAMCDQRWSFIISNKLLFNVYFGFYSLPVTNVYAYYLENTDYNSDGFLLKTENELRSMLLQKRPEALVIKPAGGTQGQGVAILDHGEYESGEINFYRNNGEKINFGGIVQLARKASSAKNIPGSIIEEKLDQHELLKNINSSSINTVRLVTMLKEDGNAFPCLSVLRVGRQGSVVDNISAGGLFIGVNEQNGELGVGSSYTKYNAGFFTHHPDSGVKFSGLKIPFWEEVKDLCIRAAKLAPFCRSIGWDVAVTPRGPILIEGNNSWAMDLQARGNGFLQPEVRDVLADYGLFFPEGKLPKFNSTNILKAFKLWTQKA